MMAKQNENKKNSSGLVNVSVEKNVYERRKVFF